MNIKNPKINILYISFCCLIVCPSWTRADSRGQLPQGGRLQDSATICLAVGLQASLTNLEDFSLETQNISGSAGALYTGQESFNLQSNGGVRVTIEADDLTNGTSKLTPSYLFDGLGEILTTNQNEPHHQEHLLLAEARLGMISDQLAGAYSGEVTLTVAPDFGNLGSCSGEQQQYPSSSYWATMAFEDLYPRPGDADYNDMVVNFRIEENYTTDLKLETVQMEFIPVARGAGYNHELMLSLDGVIDSTQNATAETAPVFTGGAEVSATYNDIDNGTSYTRFFGEGEDVLIFSNTKQALTGFANVRPWQEITEPNITTLVNISLNNPDENTMGNFTDGEFNYRPYLVVKNTGQEIDIAQINPDNGMIDANGYPFGLIVPSDWSWPAERVNINDVYPYFEEYRTWLAGETENLSAEAEEWFNYPSADAGTQVINLDTLAVQQQELD